jgi:hypothetical protein
MILSLPHHFAPDDFAFEVAGMAAGLITQSHSAAEPQPKDLNRI